MTIRIGIIGTGGMGGRHARNLHTAIVGAEVVAVSDVDEARAQQVAAACGGADVTKDPFALIQAEAVEAVIIASPDFTHAELTLECLKAGKPVLCEKPLATNASDAKKIVDAEVALGKKLVTVGFMRRFDPEHVAVKQLVAAGRVGRPVLFKGTHRNAQSSSSYSSGLGIRGSAVHDFDSARWLLEQEVETVYVQGVRTKASLTKDTFDLLSFQLGMSGGALATVEVYVNAAYGYEVAAEVVGDGGTALTPQPHKVIARTAHQTSSPVPEDWLVRFQEAYISELRDWVSFLKGGDSAGATAWDGYQSLLVADACLRSLEFGQVEHVPLASKPELYT